jgi:hypothetical protein
MRSMLVLAHYTGWSRESLLDLDTDELAEWIHHLPKR